MLKNINTFVLYHVKIWEQGWNIYSILSRFLFLLPLVWFMYKTNHLKTHDATHGPHLFSENINIK